MRLRMLISSVILGALALWFAWSLDVTSVGTTPAAIATPTSAPEELARSEREADEAQAAARVAAEQQAAQAAADAETERERLARREVLEPDLDERVRSADASLVDRDLQASRAILEDLAYAFPERDEVTRRLAALDVYDRQVEDAVPWEGSIRHVFFHSIIIHPELAFDGTYKGADFQDWNITRTELTRILEILHERDWILIDAHDLFVELEDGTVEPKPLLLPPGKKPLILSVDDVSYYDYMTGMGFASRLEVDDRLNVATRITGLDGVERLTLDGEIVPILDQFVWDNPGFSHLGAKGVLALTGYEGVFGYDTHELDADDYDERVAAATAVADRMKELGWKFASHSYSHGQSFKTGSISFAAFALDDARWVKEVGVILGPTDLYISPFGYNLKNQDRRYRHLIEVAGYNAFFPVSGLDYTWFFGDNVVQERINFDGFEMEYAAKYLAPFFDPVDVWDAEARGRPAPQPDADDS